MTKVREQLYEGMYILNAALSDEARGKAVEKLQNQITEKGGEIKKVLDWGRRRLAYDIDGKREGHYFIFYFQAPTQAIDELWREYHLNEDLIRWMTLTAEEVREAIVFKPLALAQV
jgi:small subunit ribosomal protein S6